jgi:hypothetical protein
VFTLGNGGAHPVGQALEVPPLIFTAPPVMVNRLQVFWAFAAAAELVELTRIPPPLK